MIEISDEYVTIRVVEAVDQLHCIECAEIVAHLTFVMTAQTVQTPRHRRGTGKFLSGMKVHISLLCLDLNWFVRHPCGLQFLNEGCQFGDTEQ